VKGGNKIKFLAENRIGGMLEGAKAVGGYACCRERSGKKVK
jgi:hypothetical protein